MIAEHTQTATEAPIVLQCVDLCKCYNGVVQASDHINFTLRRGEVHAFLGENGAGKSTLMKMLYGIEQPDEGQMFLSGEPVVLKSPADAIAHGIGMVHQELMLIPHLTVAENITLGQEVRTRSGRLKKQEASRSIRELAASYGLDIDPDALVDKLTIGQRQRVEIVKLLYRKADILIFDEPTALLTPQESDALFDVLRRLRELGKSTIFITHKLREVYQKPILANISGFSLDEYVTCCAKADASPYTDLIEVNVSCPNVHHGGMSFGTDPHMVYDVTRAVKEVCRKPVYMKLSPNVTDIVSIAQACEKGGADGLSLINTLMGMRIDLKKRAPVLANTTGGLSGPAVFPVALRMVWQVYEAVHLPIIGMGGIQSARFQAPSPPLS